MPGVCRRVGAAIRRAQCSSWRRRTEDTASYTHTSESSTSAQYALVEQYTQGAVHGSGNRGMLAADAPFSSSSSSFSSSPASCCAAACAVCRAPAVGRCMQRSGWGQVTAACLTSTPPSLALLSSGSAASSPAPPPPPVCCCAGGHVLAVDLQPLQSLSGADAMRSTHHPHSWTTATEPAQQQPLHRSCRLPSHPLCRCAAAAGLLPGCRTAAWTYSRGGRLASCWAASMSSCQTSWHPPRVWRTSTEARAQRSHSQPSTSAPTSCDPRAAHTHSSSCSSRSTPPSSSTHSEPHSTASASSNHQPAGLRAKRCTAHTIHTHRHACNGKARRPTAAGVRTGCRVSLVRPVLCLSDVQLPLGHGQEQLTSAPSPAASRCATPSATAAACPLPELSIGPVEGCGALALSRGWRRHFTPAPRHRALHRRWSPSQPCRGPALCSYTACRG